MVITEETKNKLVTHLYRELDEDPTNVEVNELLDELEGK